jgi:hypothetical protein
MPLKASNEGETVSGFITVCRQITGRTDDTSARTQGRSRPADWLGFALGGHKLALHDEVQLGFQIEFGLHGVPHLLIAEVVVAVLRNELLEVCLVAWLH